MDLTPLTRPTSTERVQLVGSRCVACGTFAYPARLVCSSCLGRNMAPVELSGRGTIRSWTRVELPPAGFDEPIMVADVVLDEGPSMFSLLAEEPDGGSVEAIAHPVRDGAPGYAFRNAR